MGKQPRDKFDSIEDFDKIERLLELKIMLAEIGKIGKELAEENIELKKRCKNGGKTPELKRAITKHLKAYLSLGEKNVRLYKEYKKAFSMVGMDMEKEMGKEMELYLEEIENLRGG